MSQTPSNIIPVNSPEMEVTMEHSIPMESELPTSQAIPLLNMELALTSTTTHGKPTTSELPKLNPEDLTARLEDIEVNIDTLHANRKDKEVLIFELQDSLAALENEIVVLQLIIDDAEARQADDHAQIQSILARLGL
nr:hypothetical protein [Tanacetum cinerariifolium]GFA53254.1 hypothetical protein [Tanacetum cinerariifolium]